MIYEIAISVEDVINQLFKHYIQRLFSQLNRSFRHGMNESTGKKVAMILEHQQQVIKLLLRYANFLG